MLVARGKPITVAADTAAAAKVAAEKAPGDKGVALLKTLADTVAADAANAGKDAAITWRQLLNMAPGIQWDEGQYAGADDTTQMLFSQPDMCAWAASQPLGTTTATRVTGINSSAAASSCAARPSRSSRSWRPAASRSTAR